MILVAGGTGRLGSLIVEDLIVAGDAVRVLTRSADAATRLRALGAEAQVGDVRDPQAASRAVQGCHAVVSAVTGFAPERGSTPEDVDRDGNRNLIRAAASAGVERFVLLSVHGAAPDAPLPLFRMKSAAEEALRASDLSWTIVRPTAFLETHLEVIGAPLARNGSTMLFGSGTAPMNFVSVRDVAALVLRALRDPALIGQAIELGGPDLTMNALSDALHAADGSSTGAVRRIPLPALRLMAVLARPFSPFLARAAQAAVVMNTVDSRFDALPARAAVPGLPFTTLDEAVAGSHVRRPA